MYLIPCHHDLLCKQDSCFSSNRNTITIHKSIPEHLPLLSPVARRPKLITPLPSDRNPTQSLQQRLSCTANPHGHPLVHSNFKRQNGVRMGFQTLTPNYFIIFFSTGSSMVNLHPPVRSLIWNTFHESLRSSAQMARVQKLEGKKQRDI